MSPSSPHARAVHAGPVFSGSLHIPSTHTVGCPGAGVPQDPGKNAPEAANSPGRPLVNVSGVGGTASTDPGPATTPLLRHPGRGTPQRGPLPPDASPHKHSQGSTGSDKHHAPCCNVDIDTWDPTAAVAQADTLARVMSGVEVKVAVAALALALGPTPPPTIPDSTNGPWVGPSTHTHVVFRGPGHRRPPHHRDAAENAVQLNPDGHRMVDGST